MRRTVRLTAGLGSENGRRSEPAGGPGDCRKARACASVRELYMYVTLNHTSNPGQHRWTSTRCDQHHRDNVTGAPGRRSHGGRRRRRVAPGVVSSPDGLGSLNTADRLVFVPIIGGHGCTTAINDMTGVHYSLDIHRKGFFSSPPPTAPSSTSSSALQPIWLPVQELPIEPSRW